MAGADAPASTEAVVRGVNRHGVDGPTRSLEKRIQAGRGFPTGVLTGAVEIEPLLGAHLGYEVVICVTGVSSSRVVLHRRRIRRMNARAVRNVRAASVVRAIRAIHSAQGAVRA